MFKSLLAAFVMVAAAGCAEPEPSLLINGHVFYEGGSVDDEGVIDLSGCSAKAFTDDHIVSTKLFADVSGFVPDVGLVMRNRLANTEEYAPIGTEEQLRTDSNAIMLESMVVTFDPDGPFGGVGDGGETVNPQGTLVRSAADFHLAAELVTADLRDDLQSAANSAGGDAIVPSFAEIQILGRTTGGENVESNVLTMPVEFCDGCRNADQATGLKAGFATFFCQLEAD